MALNGLHAIRNASAKELVQELKEIGSDLGKFKTRSVIAVQLGNRLNADLLKPVFEAMRYAHTYEGKEKFESECDKLLEHLV